MKQFHVIGRKEFREIQAVAVLEAVVLPRASSDDVKSVVVDKRRGKFPSSWFDSVILVLEFPPLMGVEIEEPGVIEVVEKLSSVDDEIMPDDLRTVI